MSHYQAAYGMMYVIWETEDVILNMLKQKKKFNQDFQFSGQDL